MNPRHADFQTFRGDSRDLSINCLQRLPPLFPGTPWHNPGTPSAAKDLLHSMRRGVMIGISLQTWTCRVITQKAISSVLVTLCMLASGAAIAGTPSFPSVNYSPDRLVVTLQTVTDDDVRYRCNYSVSAMYKGGGSESRSDQTDPPTGGNPVTAATLFYDNQVETATVTQWDCYPLNKNQHATAKRKPTPVSGIPCEGEACKDVAWSHDDIAIYATNIGSRVVHAKFGIADCILTPKKACGSFGLAIEGKAEATYWEAPAPPPVGSVAYPQCTTGFTHGTGVTPPGLSQGTELPKRLCVTLPRDAIVLATYCQTRNSYAEPHVQDCSLNSPCLGAVFSNASDTQTVNDRSICVDWNNNNYRLFGSFVVKAYRP